MYLNWRLFLRFGLHCSLVFFFSFCSMNFFVSIYDPSLHV